MASPFDVFPRITGARITLRQIVDEDLDALFDLYSDPAVFTYIPGEARKHKDTVRNMIGHYDRDFRKGKQIYLAVCESGDPGTLLGMAELFDYDARVNMITLGYRLRRSAWGRGIATGAVEALVAYLFEVVGVNRIQAFVMPENLASQRVLEKNRFAREGVLRQAQCWKGRGVIDLMVFSRLLSEYVGQA